MATKKAEVIRHVPTQAEAELVHNEGVQLYSPLQDEVRGLLVKTAEDYLIADQLLSRIRSARKVWKDRMERIIRPVRDGLEQIYALNRDVDRPMETLEANVKDRMRMYKIDEARRLQAAEDERQREAARLQREADEKARAAERARTPQMKGKLQAQAERAEQAASDVLAEEQPEPVRGVSSTVRPQKKVRVADLNAFLKGVIDGYIPDDYIAIIQSKLNAAFKADPEGMAAWPGVVIEDDIQIVGR